MPSINASRLGLFVPAGVPGLKIKLQFKLPLSRYDRAVWIRALTRHAWGAKTEIGITDVSINAVAYVESVQSIKELEPYVEIYTFGYEELLS